jgi:hypothetical protein
MRQTKLGAALQLPQQYACLKAGGLGERWRLYLAPQPHERLVYRSHLDTICQIGHTCKRQASSSQGRCQPAAGSTVSSAARISPPSPRATLGKIADGKSSRRAAAMHGESVAGAGARGAFAFSRMKKRRLLTELPEHLGHGRILARDGLASGECHRSAMTAGRFDATVGADSPRPGQSAQGHRRAVEWRIDGDRTQAGRKSIRRTCSSSAGSRQAGQHQSLVSGARTRRHPGFPLARSSARMATWHVQKGTPLSHCRSWAVGSAWRWCAVMRTLRPIISRPTRNACVHCAPSK